LLAATLLAGRLAQPRTYLTNLGRSIRNAAVGARLVQAEGLDSKSAADIAASLANALTELRGSNGASIDISDAVMDACTHRPDSSLDGHRIGDGSRVAVRVTAHCSNGPRNFAHS
jgi:hypothetical protein